MLEQKLLILAAWITAAGLIYGTLTRVGLVYEIYFKFLLGWGIRTWPDMQHLNT